MAALTICVSEYAVSFMQHKLQVLHKNGFGWKIAVSLQDLYSQLSPNGHLFKTDTSLRQTPFVGPSGLLVILL